MLKAAVKVLASMLVTASIASTAHAADIIEATVYHNDELKTASGLTWMGLFPTAAGQFELKPTKVTVTLVHDEIVDEPKGKKTGKKVTIAGKGEPLFLVKEVSSLRAGKVATSANFNRERLEIEQTLKLNVGDKHSTLTVNGKKKDQEWRSGYNIVLESGGTKQVVYERKEISDSSFPSLLWAGDLDGDGKIDLIMDVTSNYNVRDLALFLSSKAKQGKLVEKVATHFSTGC